MAKAKVRGLDEAIDELFKDYKTALTKAMTYAGKEARYDISFEAKSYLYEYYDNYEPNIYERTNRLINCFVPYGNITQKEKGIIVSVGMGYDSSRLDGVYNGSEKWTPVEGSWVLENYLNGIHPTTDGGGIGAEYIPIYDSVSPTQKMEKYLENYTKTFSNNVLISFVKQITRR